MLDCARDLPFDVALCVADSALRTGDLTEEQLHQAAAAARGPQADRVRRVAAYASGKAANPFESVLRALALVAGLPVIAQYEVECAGLVLHPDLANPLLGIVLEADSYEFHGMTKWDQVMNSPEYVIRTIRAWLADVTAA